ncbi:MAG: PIN domain-containing protein [Pyrinomonadaceae bacterium]
MSYLIDSGYLYAQVNGKDLSHFAVRSVRLNENEPIILPVPAITEITFLLQRDLGHHAVWEFVDTLAETDLLLESPQPSDYQRATEVLRTYSDANIDFVDACIVAMAERLNITKILTIDRRHFSIFRPKHCNTFEILP